MHYSRSTFVLTAVGLAGRSVRPAATPPQRFHLLPLAAVLDPHVVPDRVGVREVAAAGGHRAQRTVPRVVRRQVSPGRRSGPQPRAAQRALCNPHASYYRRLPLR